MLFHLIFVSALLLVAYALGRALESLMNSAENLLVNARNMRPEVSVQAVNDAGTTDPERFLATLSGYSSRDNEVRVSRQ